MSGTISSSDHKGGCIDNLQDFIIEFGKLRGICPYSTNDALDVPSISVLLIATTILSH